MPFSRVAVTDEAKKIIDTLREQHGELIFHQSGGCCDGTAPMCFAKGELMLGGQDVRVGTIHGCDFFMDKEQFEYTKYTHTTVDISHSTSSSFSLEVPMGVRFISVGRLFTPEEEADLEPVVGYDEL